MFSEQRSSSPSLLLSLVLANAFVLALCGALYLGLAAPIKSNNLETEGRRLDLYKQLIETDLAGTISDLRVLASGDGIVSYLETGSPADLDHAVRRAVFISKDNPDYDKVRYIDENGEEIMRVNHNGVVVPKEKLQDKSSRPFFLKASALGPGQIFFSTIDLNVEYGQIEQPIKPTLRLAMPLFDASGKRRGIYVINYLAGHIADQLRKFVPRRAARLRILNEQGYWITGPSPETEWGSVLPERASYNVAKADPALWTRVQTEVTGQAPYQGGYFTWLRVAPKESAPGKPITIVAEDDYFVLASVMTPQEWAESLEQLRQTFIAVGLLLVVLTSFMTRFFHSRRRAQLERDRFFNLTRDMLCLAGFDGRFKRVNPAWQQTLGYAAEEMQGQPFLDFVHPDDKEKTMEEANRLEHGSETVGFENRYRCKDGSYRWLLWSARSLPEEKVIYASARDTTARKESEESIRQLNEELNKRADQLEAANKELESFSYSVSHDLRAPLRHIHGFVEILQKSPALQQEAAEQRHMAVIARAAREMGLLIDDLLAFSRTGRAEMQVVTVDMRELVDQAIRSLEIETRDRKVVWDIKPLAPAEGDPALLRLVWSNLLGNAVKYTRPRAEARIEIGQNEADANVDQHREAIYYVRDNGVGFDMRYASKLFGVFQRLHRAEDFEGTGIGLANVQRIIHRHGGRVWADSKVDVGSTFYFSMPLEAAEGG